jgi:hypothetical protein
MYVILCIFVCVCVYVCCLKLKNVMDWHIRNAAVVAIYHFIVFLKENVCNFVYFCVYVCMCACVYV